MKYKKYEFPSFNVYTVKCDKFKSCHMEIIYRDNFNEEDFINRSLIGDIVTICSQKYPKPKDVVIKKEELYRTRFYGVTTRIGNGMMTNFIMNFINPNYALEKTFLEEVLKFPFEMLENPNICDDEFDSKVFNIIKNQYKDSIKAIKENPSKLAINRALTNMDPDSPSSYGLIKSEEQLNDITPKSLYKNYKKMIKESLCDIFIIGNLDMDKVAKIIEKNFHNRVIKTKKAKMYAENKMRRKVLEVSESSKFVQSNLINIFNLNDLTVRERNHVFPLFNYIFGNGTLNSKLCKYLREENSLCYSVGSMYLKYDKLLMVKTSLAKENVKLANKLIIKALKEMQKGDFTLEQLDDAKTGLLFGTKVSLDNPVSIIDNYVFNVYDNITLLEERPKAIKSVTKEEIVNLAKKIKLNTVYVLGEEEK
ncbi:MAG: insulinase family protein [Bacilli bacterium]|nr:insulinase family protein [Bacilli bacterium]